jgi:hypothetical protein
MNPNSEYHSSFYSSMGILGAVAVVLDTSVFCFGIYLDHSEHKKRNLCNSSKSHTLGIVALIV